MGPPPPGASKSLPMQYNATSRQIHGTPFCTEEAALSQTASPAALSHCQGGGHGDKSHPELPAALLLCQNLLRIPAPLLLHKMSPCHPAQPPGAHSSSSGIGGAMKWGSIFISAGKHRVQLWHCSSN